MRKYESLYIVHPDVVGEALTAMEEKFQAVLTEQQAEILKFDNWGTRKLAYPIKKQTKGCYVQTIFEASAEVIAEYERRLRLDETVLRFLTLRFEGDLSETPTEAVAALDDDMDDDIDDDDQDTED
ncbi:MAG: 30S ribosomal protein S6 [Deltaproteobacteria bacterium]|nr:30S ribosomal protein S6 [Deltaproteobacteria bacterium]NCP02849.1 30S ribosomal protein S6 [Deltaproteobacteria bacterium]